MATMQAICIREFGGPEVLRLETVSKPDPGDTEVCIRVHAASVNPVDYKIRAGSYPTPNRSPGPQILGRDLSGVIERCGAAVSDFKPGDEVYVFLDPARGAYAQYVCTPASLCAKKPRTIDHTTAAAVPLAAITAWQGLFSHAQLQPEQTVLVHGGAGGVGHFAIQLAKARGARVITTVSTQDIEFARTLGADQVIDYKTQRFDEELADIDVVFDLVAGDTQQRSWSVLRANGVLVSTLGEPQQPPERKPGQRGIGYMASADAGQLAQLRQLIDERSVKPHVSARYALVDAARAHAQLEHDHVRGKVVLEVT